MKNKMLPEGGEKSPDEISVKSLTNHAGNTQIKDKQLPEILFITSYPPRECGIATYSFDLIKALNNKFENSFSLKVCALEAGTPNRNYPNDVKYILNTNESHGYLELAQRINLDVNIGLVLVQHEFGFFHNAGPGTFLNFLDGTEKPVIIVFHTVLPVPNEPLKEHVRNIAAACQSVLVMTKNSSQILINDYGVENSKIKVIEHGTHLVQHLNKDFLKEKYELAGRKVLSTFGLLGPGKSIETTLNALPLILKENPEVTFVIIGKTHPGVIQTEGERYRKMLETKVDELNLRGHVRFINEYLPLPDLLEYLQLTDIYLFTSKDPNQAVSGTFSYALSCAAPVISTPIPHALEVLSEDTGIIIDFQNSLQLANAVNRLMIDEQIRSAFSSNTLQRIVPTAWENSAIAHAMLIKRSIRQSHTNDNQVAQGKKISLRYRLPATNLRHAKRMTTDFGFIQFARINQPDLNSGYTLDDNARALIAFCMHFELTANKEDLEFINLYLDFIGFCQKPEGQFFNYVDKERKFTEQNYNTDLADANGRALWALGYLISRNAIFPDALIDKAEAFVLKALSGLENIHSSRAIAFSIKGLYYYNLEKKSPEISKRIKILANRLVQMYRHESEEKWQWFESYLTYANSILPEALLFAWLETGNPTYKEIATISFEFLMSHTFKGSQIKVISNNGWEQKGQKVANYGEQPIDVAYTILAMDLFYSVFEDSNYLNKMEIAFNWFLGNNHLHQIIYNPCTGGCYDGLEEKQVNLNQGAESTVSYLMARLTMEKYLNAPGPNISAFEYNAEISLS